MPGPKRNSDSSDSVLEAFQASFSAAVMRPLGPGETISAESRAVAEEYVKPNDRLSSGDRLQIYNQQYWWRIQGSFADDFRGLAAVLGARKFEKLSASYLRDCGSHSWNLRDLGSRLGEYLDAHPDLIAPHDRLARDMAAVEWARVVAFDGEEKPKLDTAKFGRRKPEKMTLGLQPYLTLLEIHYPVDRMLGRLKNLESAAASNAMSGSAKPRLARIVTRRRPQPQYLVVHRSELLVYYKRLDREAFRLLAALREGHPLEAACELAFADSIEPADATAEQVGMWFSAWMRFGWLCER